MDTKIRAWWSYRQGLDGSLMGKTAREVLTRTGWSRSVAGASPYLALYARAGLRRAEVDAEMAKLQVHELPSARGCTYIVPAEDFPLALKVGENFSSKTEVAVARKLGVTDAEITKLKSAVLKALNKEPQDPDTLRTAVGNAARSLGPQGVKKGLTTTLPLALGLLQSEGAIRRVPVNGRIDQQRYKYALWKIAPKGSFTDLASRYFIWIGAASLSEFQWFSGLGVKAAKEAIGPLNLVPLQADLLIHEQECAEFESFQPPKNPHYVLTGVLDNITHLRRTEDAERYHLILDRGSVIGHWHFDPETSTIAWNSSIKKNRALEEAVARTEAFICEDLGDARTFSLDSPKSRVPALTALRKAAGA
jgi:hypothetical protein